MKLPPFNFHFVQVCIAFCMLGLMAISALSYKQAGGMPPWLLIVFGGEPPTPPEAKPLAEIDTLYIDLGYQNIRDMALLSRIEPIETTPTNSSLQFHFPALDFNQLDKFDTPTIWERAANPETILWSGESSQMRQQAPKLEQAKATSILPAAQTQNPWQTFLAMFALIAVVGASFRSSLFTTAN